MVRRTKVSWLAAASMLSAFTVGVALAISHHVFYHGLDGKHPPTWTRKIVGFETSQQQINDNVGTAFAFLVKAFLATAVGLASIQVFWTTLKASSKSTTLAKVDTAYSLQNNLLSLLTVSHWWRSPLLFFLALLVWLLPLASIVTPGTLSIDMITESDSFMEYVPYLNFTSLNFAAGMYPDPNQSGAVNATTYWWNGPSQVLQRTAAAVLAQGEILPIPPPATNSSIAQDFYAPSLTCNPMNAARALRVEQSIRNYTTYHTCWTPNLYLAWYGDVPFVSNSSNGAFDRTPETIASASGEQAELSIAVLPHMAQYSVVMSTHIDYILCDGVVHGMDNTLSPEHPLGTQLVDSSTYLECSLFNTSYTVQYNYTNGEQDIIIDAPHRDSDQPVNTLEWVWGPYGFGKACVQSGPPPEQFGRDNPFNCTTVDPKTVQTLAYQGVLEAFAKLLIGHVSPTRAGSGLVYNSSIISSVLLDTPELTFLKDRKTALGSVNLQESVQRSSVSGYSAAEDVVPIRSGKSLASTIEESFRNYTVSLMSVTNLQPNISQDALMRTNVTTFTYSNVYVYSATRLWLAYGLAVGFTGIAVAIGLFTIFSNGVSYSSNFSTILRSAHIINLSADVRPEDAHGGDPLPAYLARANVAMTKAQLIPIPQDTK